MWEKYIFSNGVKVLTEEMPYVHSAVIGIWVKTGSRYENLNNHGVSHFIEHLLFKGTANRTAKQIVEELEAVGGSLNAFTTKEYTCFYAKILAEHLHKAMELLCDMFFNSLFLQEDIEKEKNVILEEVKMYEDSPDEIIHDLFAQTIWKNHSLGRTILGTADSIKALTRTDIMSYYTQHYCPGNTVIAVAGKIKHDDIVDKLSKYFSEWDNRPCPVGLEQPQTESSVIIAKKDTEQVQICLGVPGLPQEHAQSYALLVLNNVLGGGLSSRLFQEIREDRGLAYSIYSYHTTYLDTGLLAVYAGTSPNRFDEVVKLIATELVKLKIKGITREELLRAKEQIKGNLLLGMESASNRMSRLGRTEICYGRVITAEEVVKRISEVEFATVNQLCRELFQKEKFTLTAIGPVDEQNDFYAFLTEIGM